MKRILFLFSFVLIGSFAAEAQSSAIGLRFGGLRGVGAEISYQQAMGSSNRLEVDLGWNFSDGYDAIGVVAIYQWVWPINAFPQGFNWYAGVGADAGYWNYENDAIDSDFAVGIDGQIGIEYNFDFPLQISLDWRPRFLLIPDTDFGDGDLALGLRYKF